MDSKRWKKKLATEDDQGTQKMIENPELRLSPIEMT